MEQRVSLITLGVTDLARAKAFYEQLGWRGQEVEQTVFFQAGGLAVVLWDRRELAADARIDDAEADGFGGVGLAHNVRSQAEVEQVLAAARNAGATVTRSAAPTFYGGYAGCFTDLDGHLWEIAYNPGFPLAADGSLTVPQLSSARRRCSSFSCRPARAETARRRAAGPSRRSPRRRGRTTRPSARPA
jgi:catechol 2,3-dioxygenase-like lactoylglutathione lyase family enzyme